MRPVIDHPSYYGGKHHPYEAIKIIEALGLNFHIGNAIKYLVRAGRKSADTEITDLEKAKWYVQRLIDLKTRRRRPGRSHA
jgi:hypothetical protein